jgi:hypothetical protein
VHFDLFQQSTAITAKRISAQHFISAQYSKSEPFTPGKKKTDAESLQTLAQAATTPHPGLELLLNALRYHNPSLSSNCDTTEDSYGFVVDSEISFLNQLSASSAIGSDIPNPVRENVWMMGEIMWGCVLPCLIKRWFFTLAIMTLFSQQANIFFPNDIDKL